jgi:hypothetical protein
MDLRRIRIERRRPAIALDRIAYAPQRIEAYSKVVMKSGSRRGDLNCGLIEFDPRRELPAMMGDHAPQVQRLGILRL